MSDSSELTFQRAYARFLKDASFRDQITSGTTLPDFDPVILSRLRGIDVQRASLFAELLVGNQLATLQEALPCTAASLGPTLQEVLRTFNEEAPAPDHRKYPEACAFADFLLRRISVEPLARPYLTDLVTYELAKLQLRFEYNETMWPEAIKTSESEFASALANRNVIYLHRHANQALISFSYDVEYICEELRASRTPNVAEPKISIILLHVDRDGVLHEEAVNGATAAFILLVNGHSALDQIVGRFLELCDGAQSHDNLAAENEIPKLCASLIQRGIIGFTIGGPPNKNTAASRDTPRSIRVPPE